MLEVSIVGDGQLRVRLRLSGRYKNEISFKLSWQTPSPPEMMIKVQITSGLKSGPTRDQMLMNKRWERIESSLA